MKITLNKGGTGEREIDVQDIVIPDLWHAAQQLRALEKASDAQYLGSQVMSALVLEGWHLAHDLLCALQELENE